MQNKETRIYVVGSIKAFGVYRSLSKKYGNVYHFKDEINNDLLDRLPPQIIIIEESEKLNLENVLIILYFVSNDISVFNKLFNKYIINSFISILDIYI
mgnify:CR=1 FL=1